MAKNNVINTIKTYKQQLAELKAETKYKINLAKIEQKARKQALKDAERTGWNSGIRDHRTLPDVKGAKNKAVKGYKNSMRTADKAREMAKKVREK